MKLYVREAGSGEALVLLHGNGENSSYFEYQIPYFSQHYHVIAVDTRGHGKSPRGTKPFTLIQFAKDLKQLLDQMGLKKVNLLGFSDGGNIALIFAIVYPSYVNKLIVNGANIFPNGMKKKVEFSIFKRYYMLTLCPKKTAKLRHEKELVALMTKEPRLKWTDLWKIKAPTLVIVGDRDLISERHTRKIAEWIPDSKLVILAGGHSVARENWKKFNFQVEHFLSEPHKIVQ